jgi:EmrB/QacA subfamily drug resistance transporter
VSTTTPRNPWLVLTSTSLAVFAVFLDTTILFVAFPALTHSFPSVSTASLSWVLNAYTIVFAAALIPAGRLADRVGRRRVFLGAVVVFTVASVLCGLAPSVGALILFRIVQALGAAAMIPASLALVLQTFPRQKIPVAVAIWGAVGAVAGAIGPTLGAAIVEGAGWRWAFFVNLPVGIVSFLLARRVLPEGREEHPGPIPDLVGALLLIAGMSLLALGIVQSDDWGWTSAPTVAVLAAGGIALLAFVARCRRVANPLLDLRLFEIRNFRWGNVGTIAFAIAFNAIFFANIQFLTRVWGYSVFQAGLAVTPGPLVVAVLAPVFGRVAARIGQRRLLLPGGLVYAAAGLLAITRIGAEPAYVAEWLPYTLLTGLGVALCLPQLSSASVQGLPPDRFGSGSAVNQALRNLGATFGVALVVAILSAATAPGQLVDAFRHAWALLVVCGIAVTLASTQLGGRARVDVPVRVPVEVG